jgi:hypothetical protein
MLFGRKQNYVVNIAQTCHGPTSYRYATARPPGPANASRSIAAVEITAGAIARFNKPRCFKTTHGETVAVPDGDERSSIRKKGA